MAARALAAASLLLGMATTGLALDAPALPSVDEARKFTLEQVGAYKVLTPRGVTGWIGAGWIVPIS